MVDKEIPKDTDTVVEQETKKPKFTRQDVERFCSDAKGWHVGHVYENYGGEVRETLLRDGFEYDFKVNGVLITLTELVSKEDAGRCRFIEYDNITNINLGDNPLI
ncbi:MAG TPA: hypothetical protein VJJ22_00835 [Candidatus Paceibacterota bacterium]